MTREVALQSARDLGGPMPEEHVRFFSGGRERPAVVITPNAGAEAERRPAVVLAHGLANDLDEAGQFGTLAETLSALGHVVLRFDFRGGVRDLDPGRQLPATEWPEDLLAAISSLRTRRDVDPERVGVIGASTGGSVAVSVAALDPALRYVVTLGCFADGERWLRELWTRVHGKAAWTTFFAQMVADRSRRAGGEPSRRVALAGEFLPVPADELPEIERFLDANPGMLRELALEVADNLLLLSPEQLCHRGSCPVLVVHGTDDTLVPLEEASRLGTALGERGTKVVVEGGLHQLLLGDQAPRALEVVSSWISSLS